MAEKRPAFQWYPKDYLSDENVALMTLEQEGAYARLLNYCWLQGSIPSDLDALARLCRVPAVDMERIWPGVEKCFKHTGDRYTHGRLDKERAKQDAYKKAKSEAGRRGAKAKWDKEKDGSAIDSPLAKHGFSSASASASAFPSTEQPTTTPKLARPKQPPAPAPTASARGFSTLADWLGEYAGCLAGVTDLAQRAWFGTWGPTGTDAGVWRAIAPERQPPIMATAILAWAASSRTGEFHRGFCRKVLVEAIDDAITADRKRADAEREAEGTDELREGAAHLETVEVARLTTEGQQQVERQREAKAWYDSQPPHVQRRVEVMMEPKLRRFGTTVPALIAAAALADAVESIRALDVAG